MRVNLLKVLDENFKIKVFAVFTVLVAVISLAYSAIFINDQNKHLDNDLIEKGSLLAGVLAHNLRMGVFSENESLLNAPIEAAFQQEEVFEVSVFNREGELLAKRKKPGSMFIEESVKKDDDQSTIRILEKLNEIDFPYYLEGRNKIEFWSAVISGATYTLKDSLLFQEKQLQNNYRIIGLVKISVDKKRMKKRIKESFIKSFLMCFIFFVVGSGTTYFVSRRITRPLNKLTKAVKALEAGGAFRKVPVETRDEIGRLAKAFNDMSDSLENRENSLRESESRYRDLIENIEDMIYEVNEKWIFTYVSPQSLAVLGYEPEELLGKSLFDFMQPEERERNRQEFLELLPNSRSISQLVVKIISKEGTLIWVEFSGRFFFNPEGKFLGMRGVQRNITERIWAEQALSESEEKYRVTSEQLRNLSIYLQSSMEKERERVSREIHDDLGQYLTSLKMDLSWFKKRLPKDQSPLHERAKSMQESLDIAIDSVERVVYNLRPGPLEELGLTAAIEWLIGNFQKNTGITCRYRFDQEEYALDSDRGVAIYRILQEALTNISRHSKATEVDIDLYNKDGCIILKVADNGIGISKTGDFKSGSFGIMGMQERAYFFQGRVEIEGSQYTGTTVTANIPFKG